MFISVKFKKLLQTCVKNTLFSVIENIPKTVQCYKMSSVVKIGLMTVTLDPDIQVRH